MLSVRLTCHCLCRPLPKGQIIKVRMHNFMVGVTRTAGVGTFMPVPVAPKCLRGVPRFHMK